MMDKTVLDRWDDMAKLAFQLVVDMETKKVRYTCNLCNFIIDLGEREAKSVKTSSRRELGVSLMIQHMRSAHRHIYLNMVDRVYGSLHRGIPLYPNYQEGVDGRVLGLLMPITVGAMGDRKLGCCLCGFEAPYRGIKPHESDKDIDHMAYTHLLVCHRDEMADTADISREAWEREGI